MDLDAGGRLQVSVNGGLKRSANDKSRRSGASDREYENDNICDKLSYRPLFHDVSAVFTVDIRLCNSVGDDVQQRRRWLECYLCVLGNDQT